MQPILKSGGATVEEMYWYSGFRLGAAEVQGFADNGRVEALARRIAETPNREAFEKGASLAYRVDGDGEVGKLWASRHPEGERFYRHLLEC